MVTCVSRAGWNLDYITVFQGQKIGSFSYKETGYRRIIVHATVNVRQPSTLGDEYFRRHEK